MTPANDDHARTARAAIVLRQLIHHVAAWLHEWTQEGAVQSPDTKSSDAHPDPAKDEDAQDARQETQGNIGEDIQKRFVCEFGAVKIKQENGEADS